MKQKLATQRELLSPDTLFKLDDRLLDVTLRDLQCLLLVKALGNPAAIVDCLKQRNITRQYGTYSTRLHEVCEVWKSLSRTPVEAEHKHGEPYQFTPAGEAVIDWANSVLESATELLTALDERNKHTLIVATTTFTLPFIASIWRKVQATLGMGAEIRAMQIKTSDIFPVLDSEQASLVAGAVIGEAGKDPKAQLDPEYDGIFVPPQEASRLGLLTWDGNPRIRGIKTAGSGDFEVLNPADLAQEPLIIPKDGIVTKALCQVMPNWRNELNQAWTIEDVHYGKALLYTGVARGSMFILESVGKEFKDGATPKPHDSFSGSPELLPAKLKYVRLGGSFERLRFYGGIIAKKSRLSCHCDKHLECVCKNDPLKVFWDYYSKEAQAANAKAAPSSAPTPVATKPGRRK